MNSNTIKLIVVALAGAAALTAWFVPGPKPDTVAQRLDYPQFVIALVVTAAALSVMVSAIFAGAGRRALIFRVVAVWFGVGLALATWEFGAWAWPAGHLMDNPWYTVTGTGIVASEHLPHQRPPGLTWTGISRGDLAMLDNSPDPDARTITYATDSKGFRNADEADQADIIVLGDSFTEAGYLPLAETFVILTGERSTCTVRNLGVAGYSAPSELIVLKRFGLNYLPRVVVWQIAESNDLGDALRFDDWVRKGRPDFRANPRDLPTGANRWRKRSPTHRLFDLLRSRDSAPSAIAFLAGTFRDSSGAEREVRFLPTLPGAQHSPAGNPGWPLTASAIRDGADMLRDRKIDLVVVLIPMKLRALADSIDFHPLPVVTDRAQPAAIDRLPTGWDLKPEATLASHLAAICDEVGARFVDTTPALKQHAARGELVYMAMDTHLSPAGHRIVAKLLVDALDGITCHSGAAAQN